MNPNASTINKLLSQDNFLASSEKYLNNNPDYSVTVHNVPVRLDDSIELFNYLKEVVLQIISNGNFEKLPTNSQVSVLNQVKAVANNKDNVSSFITSLQGLYHHIRINGLEMDLEDYNLFKDSLKNIANLRKSYSGTLRGLESSRKKVKVIEANFEKSNKTISDISQNAKTLQSKIKDSDEKVTKINANYEKISANLQEVENAKKEIIAFKANINEYKEDVNTLNKQTEEIIEKFESQQETVNDLISSAENALKLKSSEGLSAALSVQYDSENKRIKKLPWLITAGVFLLFALFGVFVLLFDVELFGLKAVSNSLNAIIARIVFVAISITGASFCAAQYIKQKSLADEYGYRLVLAKSLIAFSYEIEKHNPEIAVKYMKEVLDVINKTPINKGKESEKLKGVTNDHVNVISNIANLLKTKT